MAAFIAQNPRTGTLTSTAHVSSFVEGSTEQSSLWSKVSSHSCKFSNAGVDVHFDGSNGGVGDMGGDGNGGEGGGCSLRVDHIPGGPSNCWQCGQPYLINHASAPVNMSQEAWLVWFSLTTEEPIVDVVVFVLVVGVVDNGKFIITHPRMSLSNALAFLNMRCDD